MPATQHPLHRSAPAAPPPIDAPLTPPIRAAEPLPAEARKPAPPASDPVEDRALCDWVARIAAADERAWGLLFDATVGRVYSMARGITRNQPYAEQVTEHVYWQVWRQAPRFDRQRGPVMAWLLTLARSHALADDNDPIAVTSPEDADPAAVS